MFHDARSRGVLSAVGIALERTYGIEVREALEREPPREAFNARRRQFDASALLNILAREGRRPFLWILSPDIYVKGMNFVFGVALFGIGAVLSTHRLHSLDLVRKEAIHEIGHVLGLSHCENECVMQFSNSVAEAEMKPSELCNECKNKLRKMLPSLNFE
ncbi:MAG: putative Zn-dependent protease [Candidatus Alkanophagales archaeon MCA70_species_1]|nr:putative Zn-dependent protease [Candidatus Alkanophaga volatiphilum]